MKHRFCTDKMNDKIISSIINITIFIDIYLSQNQKNPCFICVKSVVKNKSEINTNK